MEQKYVDIITKGQKDGKTYEEINAELKAAGANFHLDADGKTAGWSEAEIAEGFKPGEPAKKAQRELDMSRKVEFAGTVQIQRIPGGKFEVTYDEDGYAKKARKI